MSKDRSKILTDALRVSPSEVRWHFAADYYDGPISGLAFFRERIYRFCCFLEDVPEHHVYVLHELAPEELTEELRIKEKFETFVGTHSSYDQTESRWGTSCVPRNRGRFFTTRKTLRKLILGIGL